MMLLTSQKNMILGTASPCMTTHKNSYSVEFFDILFQLLLLLLLT